MEMFCYQCEQAGQGTGCTQFGVCGKPPEVSALQDLLVHACKGIAMHAHRARALSRQDRNLGRFIAESLFSTVTNVDFDEDRLSTLLGRAGVMIQAARRLYEEACVASGILPEKLPGPARWAPAADRHALIAQGKEVGIPQRRERLGAARVGLQELVTYGLKGMAAYTHHAAILGAEDDEVYDFFYEALDALTRPDPTADDLLGLSLRCGEMNLRVMGMLDEAHRAAFGDPVPTRVRVEPVRGKAIVVSGHDLKDLHELLKQTERTGINVYTHGEMLPAHGYPGLKRFRHLAGNYGGAWQDQQKEFDRFPGAILMTTNCIQRPRETYKARLFTSGLVAWPGVAHIPDRDFTPVIRAALEAEGFHEDGPDRFIQVGFGHGAILSVADRLLEAVQAGHIRHLFLVGGCDGAKAGRNYFTRLAEAIPPDCLILTLACGKYRFNKMEFGEVAGLPRLIDCGQCNDAYSAIRVAEALAEALDTDVNGLPLSLVLSWYEQKAVAILLTLLHLGVRNIRLGPSLPPFLAPEALQVLAERFNLMPITTPEADLKAILGAETETASGKGDAQRGT